MFNIVLLCHSQILIFCSVLRIIAKVTHAGNSLTLQCLYNSQSSRVKVSQSFSSSLASSFLFFSVQTFKLSAAGHTSHVFVLLPLSTRTLFLPTFIVCTESVPLLHCHCSSSFNYPFFLLLEKPKHWFHHHHPECLPTLTIHLQSLILYFL